LRASKATAPTFTLNFLYRTMRKILFVQLLFLVLSASSYAQSMEDLRSINSRAKDSFIPPDKLDQLVNALRKYEENPLPDQDTLLLETYKVIVNSYMVNNHFKQAHQLFTRYLAYKEKMLAKDKADAINRVMNTVAERSRNDETEYRNLQNQVSELKKGNENLESRRLNFKRNFSFALIFLSAMFAVMLVGSGVKMMNLRSKLNQNRERMKSIHKSAVTGKYDEGLRNSLDASIANLESELKELKSVVKS
jgi:hypothetical protein